MRDLGQLLLILSVFLSIGGTNLIRNDVSNSKDVSKICYYCIEEDEGKDNLALCSNENDLNIEDCSLEDLFDKCIVVQAFSRSKNTTIFKRECTTTRYCEERTACSDEDLTDCRYECCTGDLCNNFGFSNFSNDVGSNTFQPTVAVTTQKHQEQVQSETVVTESAKRTTVVPVVTTQDNEVDARPVTTQKLPVTTKKNEDDSIVPVVEEGCEDFDTFCPTYVTDHSHWPMFCKDNDRYTSIACRKTCKFCISSHEVTTKTSTQKPTEIETTITTEAHNVEAYFGQFPDCKDLRSDCRELKILEYCRLMSNFMKKECARTCGFCGSGRENTPTKSPKTEKVMTFELVTTELEAKMEPTIAKPVNTDFPATSAEKRITSSTEKQTTGGVQPQTTNIMQQQSTSNLQQQTTKIVQQQTTNNMQQQTTSNLQQQTTNSVQQQTTNVVQQTSNSVQQTKNSVQQHTTNRVQQQTTNIVQQTTNSVQQHATNSVQQQTTNSVQRQTTSGVVATSELTEILTISPTTSDHVQSGVAVPTTTENENCQDKRDNCGYLQSMDYCRIMTWYMDKNCRKTCGLCSNAVVGGPAGTNAPKPTDKNITTKSPTTQQTKRTEQIASSTEFLHSRISSSKATPLATEKETEESPQPTHEATSAFKMSTVKSQNTSKPAISTEREVTNTTALTSTEKSISHSSSSPVTSEEVTEPSPEPTTSQLTAPPTSQSNVVPTPKRTMGEDCHDKSPRCAEFAKIDAYCDYHRKFMAKHCPKSCGFCSSGVATTAHPTTSAGQTTASTEPSHVTQKATSPMTESRTAENSTDEPTSEFERPTLNLQTTPKLTTSTERVARTAHSNTSAGQTTASTEPLNVTQKATPPVTENRTAQTSTDESTSEFETPTLNLQTTQKPATSRIARTAHSTTSAGQTTASTEPLHVTQKATPPVTESRTAETSTDEPTSEFETPTLNLQTTPKLTTSTEQVNVAGGPMVPETSHAGIITPGTQPIDITSEATPQATEEEAERTSKLTPEPATKLKLSTVKATSKPLISSGSCKDRQKECARFARYPGYCEYTRTFMLQNCPKSCGFCDGAAGSANQPKPSEGMKTTKAITPSATERKTTETSLSTHEAKSEFERPTLNLQTTLKSNTSTERESEYDVVFVIGARIPNAGKSFDQQKKIIENTVKDSALNDARYGLVMYTEAGQTYLRKDSPLPTPFLINEILNKTSWERDGSRVDKGIRKAIEQFGSDTESKQRIVAFINAASDASDSEMKETRLEAERNGIKLIVVGMGSRLDTGEFINLAPKYGDRVVFVGGELDDDTKELSQAATDVVTAIKQEDEKESSNQGQAGIPVTGSEGIQILGPDDAQTAEFGDKLRWKIWSWGKCVNGKQSRVVRCYHLFEGTDYHVAITSCIKYVKPMPAKERDC